MKNRYSSLPGRRGVFFLLLLVLLTLPGTAHAAKHRSEWVSSKGKYYYYDENGKKLIPEGGGLVKIGKKYYYLDEKGVQRTGWRKAGKSYYYFRKYNGASGFMMKSCSVRGITLQANGKAVLTARNKRKLKIMVRCAEIIDAITKADQRGGEKLKIAFEYTKEHYRPRNIGKFRNIRDWDMYYAEYMLNHNGGDCYCYGVLFGYFASAIGYSNVSVVSSGGHGWTEIKGLYYDPNWARVIGTDKCFAASKSVSGRAGRPGWAKAGNYRINLSKALK